MKTILIVIFMASTGLYCQEMEAVEAFQEKELAQETCQKKDRKVSRVYRRANSNIKRELHFITKTKTKTA